MVGDARADALLDRLSEICLALPEATRRHESRHASFSIIGKKFAYFLVDHHGDGMIALTVRVGPGENVALIDVEPALFFMPVYLGPRGWVGYRLDAGAVDWPRVGALVAESYRFAAPKRLGKLVGA